MREEVDLWVLCGSRGIVICCDWGNTGTVVRRLERNSFVMDRCFGKIFDGWLGWGAGGGIEGIVPGVPWVCWLNICDL